MLVRPSSKRIIAGVCAAISDRFGIPVTVVRVVAVVATLFTVFPLVLYLVLWALIPRGL